MFCKKGVHKNFTKFTEKHLCQSLFFVEHLRWFLKSDSDLPKKFVYFLKWKVFKNCENCFLFHHKSSFRSQDIYIFVLTFWTCRKNDLIREIGLISKFMTSQPGYQRSTTHILSNMSRSESNQTMKVGQLRKHNKINIFLHKSCRQ